MEKLVTIRTEPCKTLAKKYKGLRKVLPMKIFLQPFNSSIFTIITQVGYTDALLYEIQNTS